MKVTTKTRYALRVMLQLGLDYEKGSGKEVSMLGDIAKRENLSEKYLSLVVIPLRAHGLINSVRGSKGGYLLARDPSRISIKDVYEATDGKVCTVDCTLAENNCNNSKKCTTREVWLKLDHAIEKTLGEITLKDLVDSYKQKNKIQLSYVI